MAVPLPNITGGAATSGDASSSGRVSFGPVNVGGLFGSTASSSSNLLIPALVLSVVVIAFLIRKK